VLSVIPARGRSVIVACVSFWRRTFVDARGSHASASARPARGGQPNRFWGVAAGRPIDCASMCRIMSLQRKAAPPPRPAPAPERGLRIITKPVRGGEGVRETPRGWIWRRSNCLLPRMGTWIDLLQRQEPDHEPRLGARPAVSPNRSATCWSIHLPVF